jgi:hypothetical protein
LCCDLSPGGNYTHWKLPIFTACSRRLAQLALDVSTAGVQRQLPGARGVGHKMEKVNLQDVDQKPPVAAAKRSIWKMVNGGGFHLEPSFV